MMREGITFDDVILVPGYNDIPQRKDVDPSVIFAERKLRLPIISANMDTITEADMAIAMFNTGGMGILHRFVSIEKNVDMFKEATKRCGDGVGVSIGIGEGGQQRAASLFSVGARIFCIDVAHGHSKVVGKQIKNLRSNYTDSIFIIAGNVATYAGADYLAGCGADAVKVGIGPGSVCTTRRKAGVGVPQLTAIEDCSRANAIIIADGGMRDSGDIVKALAAGADLVMSGSFFAGANETPGTIEWDLGTFTMSAFGNTIKAEGYKTYRGMASKEAQDDAKGGMTDWKTSEGALIKIPLKGSVEDIMRDLGGGIRSGMTYCGARTIRELQSKAEFMRVTNAGQIEGTAHGR